MFYFFALVNVNETDTHSILLCTHLTDISLSVLTALSFCITMEVGEWEIDLKALMIHRNVNFDFSDVHNYCHASGGDEEVIIYVS